MRRPGSHQIRRAAAKTTSKQGQLKKQGAEPLRKQICDKYAGMIWTKMCTWCLALGNGVAKPGRPLVDLKNAEALELVSQTSKPLRSTLATLQFVLSYLLNVHSFNKAPPPSKRSRCRVRAANPGACRRPRSARAGLGPPCPKSRTGPSSPC